MKPQSWQNLPYCVLEYFLQGFVLLEKDEQWSHSDIIDIALNRLDFEKTSIGIINAPIIKKAFDELSNQAYDNLIKEVKAYLIEQLEVLNDL